MVNVVRTESFERAVRNIKDASVKERIRKQIERIINDPFVGKPLRYSLKGERSLRVSPFRMLYAFDGKTIWLLDFGHRDNVYH